MGRGWGLVCGFEWLFGLFGLFICRFEVYDYLKFGGWCYVEEACTCWNSTRTEGFLDSSSLRMSQDCVILEMLLFFSVNKNPFSAKSFS